MDHSIDLAPQPPPTGDGARDAPAAGPAADGGLNAAISDAVVRT